MYVAKLVGDPLIILHLCGGKGCDSCYPDIKRVKGHPPV